MALIWSFCKDIKLDILNIFIHIPINHDFVNIFNATYHIYTFFRRIDHFRIRFILLNIVAILNCNY